MSLSSTAVASSDLAEYLKSKRSIFFSVHIHLNLSTLNIIYYFIVSFFTFEKRKARYGAIKYEIVLFKKTKYSVFLITKEIEVMKRRIFNCRIFKMYKNTLISVLF